MSVRSVKGVQDIYPPEVHRWQWVEGRARAVFGAYGFQEFRPPVLEHTEVFSRGIGETSDIVEKEMYTFSDRADRSLTLRPEGTASVVRAYVQHGLHTLPSPQKFYYLGPMFRYERPQKGRYRQFHQVGVEAFGSKDPLTDAEMIAMLMEFLRSVGLTGLVCRINSLGCASCRPAYRTALIDFFTPRRDVLCDDCGRRLERNPLRVLDCKAEGCAQQRQGAPAMVDYLCDECRTHFEALKGYLDVLRVPYVIDREMVRGLDYYTMTAFEVTSDALGAQSAVAAGGRYDALVKEFGGPQTPAIGFAVGLERLVLLCGENAGAEVRPEGYLIPLGEEARTRALSLAVELRAAGRWVELGTGGSLKSQMKKADRLGARYALIIGDQELERGVFNYRCFADGRSGEMALSEIDALLAG